MAKRSGPQKLPDDLKERILEAEAYHKEQYIKKADECTAILRGKTSFMPSGFDKEIDIINPNMIFSTVRTYMPALYPGNPEVYVRPKASEWIKEKEKDHVLSAFIAESALNHYQVQLEMKKQDELAVLEALAHPVAYVQDGWVTELSHFNPQIVKDQPLHKFVNGNDIIPDPDGLDFEDKSFVVRTFGKRYDQMKRYGYKNLKTKEDEISGTANGIDPNTKQPILPKFYEVWDKNTETTYISSSEDGEFTTHKSLDFDISDGFPQTPLMLNPMYDNYYGMSLIEAIKDMQKYITLMVSYGAKHAKMSIPKYVTWSDLMDTKVKRSLESGKILDTIFLRRPKGAKENMNIDAAIGSLKQPGLPPDFYHMLNIVRDFMNTISGVSESARGGSGREDTATGANIVDSYLRSRIGDYRNIVNDWISKSRRKMLKFIRKNASNDNYLRFHEMDINGQYFTDHPEFKKASIKRGQYIFVPWSKKDIDAEYDIEVGVGNAVPLNEESQYKKALQDFNILINNPVLNKARVTVDFLKKIGIANPESWIIPPPEPTQEKPKVGVNVSFKAEDMPEKVSASILQEAGLVPAPPKPGQGGENGGNVRPVDVGLQRELGLSGGIGTPPKMPEFSGR